MAKSLRRQLKAFTIDDDLSIQDCAAVEVTVELLDGRRRWCFFVTCEGLRNCGDWIEGTQIRFHYGAAHMIVVAGTLDEDTIEQALRTIDGCGELEQSTLPLDPPDEGYNEEERRCAPIERGDTEGGTAEQVSSDVRDRSEAIEGIPAV